MLFFSVTARLFPGLWVNMRLFLLTLLFSLPLGLVVCYLSMSRISAVKYLCRGFVWAIRGTPLMLQVIIVYYGPGLIWYGRMLPRDKAALVAFIINYACYFSEIFRGGIENLPKGQIEAAQVLGLTRRETFFKITLLQLIKRTLPTLGNEFTSLVKDTSLARVIAIKELTMTAQEYISTSALIWPLFYSGIFYLVVNTALSAAFAAAEKKLSYFKV